jgi:hypothetical protein
MFRNYSIHERGSKRRGREWIIGFIVPSLVAGLTDRDLESVTAWI